MHRCTKKAKKATKGSEPKPVSIRKGRFGYYIRAGNTIAGLRNLDPDEVTRDRPVFASTTYHYLSTVLRSLARFYIPFFIYREWFGLAVQPSIPSLSLSFWLISLFLSYLRCANTTQVTLEQAIELLVTKGRVIGRGAKASRTKKATASTKSTSKGTKTTSKEDTKQKQNKKKAATATGRKKVAIKATPKTKRAPSGYQIFVSASLKSGIEGGMKEAAAQWRAMDDSEKAAYNERAKALSENVAVVG